MDRIAVFDVDFTLTKRETQLELLRFLIKRKPAYLRYLPNSMMAGLLYVLKLHDEKASKEQNLKILRGLSIEELNQLAHDFFDETIKPMLYVDGLKAIRHHQRDGMRVILSSASPEFYISQFERSPFIEKAMGSRFEIKDGRFTGKMIGANNKGTEKVARLMEYLGDTPIDWEYSVMYSDSLSDQPLMDCMGQAFLINHKPNDQFQVLDWK